MTLAGQDGRQLYVVAGLVATNASSVSVPASLLAIDQDKPAAVKLLDLGGGSLIMVDHDRRLVVIGDFSRHLVELPMDSPTSARTINTNFGPEFVCTPPNATVEVGCVDAIALEHRLSSIELTGSNAGKQQDLPLSNYRFVRTEGYWSPVDPANNPIFLFLKNIPPRIRQISVFRFLPIRKRLSMRGTSYSRSAMRR